MLKPTILMILFFSAAAFSAIVFSTPEDPLERKQYTASLNSMASIVMNWYGNVLHTDGVKPDDWQDYIAQFPDGITQIEITGTDLVQLATNKQYQFIVDIKLRNKHKNKFITQTMSNTFLFGFDVSKKITLQKITSTPAQEIENQSTEIISDNEFTHSYFMDRAVAYAWLAYLDGSVLPEELKNQFDQVQYTLTMGNHSWQDSASTVLSKRQPYLAVGGHVLRVVKAEQTGKASDRQLMTLTIEWKGMDKDGTPVWANIQQIIEYRLLKSGGWEIMSVKEKHLLPDTQPWIGLLC